MMGEVYTPEAGMGSGILSFTDPHVEEFLLRRVLTFAVLWPGPQRVRRSVDTVLLCLILALPGCETGDECFLDADCDDSDFCTQDRCRVGRCSHLGVPGCCHGDSDCGPSFGPRCDTDSHRCVECLSDADCGSGRRCDLRLKKCAAPQAGTPCAGDSDCDGGWCLAELESGYPGGFCGQACQGPEDCGSYACVDVFGSQKSCLPVCFGDQDCRPEYICLPTAPDRGACFPHCIKNEDCPAANSCNPWVGLCMGAAPGGDNGERCSTDADCKGFCAKEADTGAPGGVCVSICSPSKIACPGSDACVWQLSPYLNNVNVCLPVYDQQVGCRPEYAPLVAIEYLIGADPQPVGTCQPACRGPNDCASGNCNRYSGLCDDPEAGAEHGAACGNHEQCKGLCLTFWPDGYCTGPCRPAAQDCPGDSGCLNLGVQHSCAGNCQSDPDCRPGYYCEQTVFKCVPPP
jgi:Cys-rich repeat protein